MQNHALKNSQETEGVPGSVAEGLLPEDGADLGIGGETIRRTAFIGGRQLVWAGAFAIASERKRPEIGEVKDREYGRKQRSQQEFPHREPPLDPP